jgi:hypothetical protein
MGELTMTYDMEHEDDAREVKLKYDASVAAGTVALAVLIVIACAGTVLAWAAMASCHAGVRP